MELNTILNILTQYKLTADELLLIYVTFCARDEENHPEYLIKCMNNGIFDKVKVREMFNSLKAKGIINKNYDSEEYNPDEIEFNKLFLKSFVKSSFQLGKELFDEYPNCININGRIFSLKNISKKFMTQEEFFFHYSSSIKHNPETHKHVMEMLRWGKANGKINFGILEWVASKKWEYMEYLKNNGSQLEGQVETSFNVFESI